MARLYFAGMEKAVKMTRLPVVCCTGVLATAILTIGLNM
jgi:hypothetical protein